MCAKSPVVPHVSETALRVAAERSYGYLRGIGARSVAPNAAALAGLAEFHEPFPERPCDPAEAIAKLCEFGGPATVATTGGRYFGFVIGGALPAALAASWVANTWDQNAVFRVMSPVAAELEEVVLRWVCEALGLPGDCEGGIGHLRDSGEFHRLVRSTPGAAGETRLERRRRWNVWGVADSGGGGRGGARIGFESTEHGGIRTKTRDHGGGGRPGANASREAAGTGCEHIGVHSGRQREYRLV